MTLAYADAAPAAGTDDVDPYRGAPPKRRSRATHTVDLALARRAVIAYLRELVGERDQGEHRCVVYLELGTWVKFQGPTRLPVGVAQIAHVLKWCDRLGIDTPDEFGHETADGKVWLVVESGGFWHFYLCPPLPDPLPPLGPPTAGAAPSPEEPPTPEDPP